MTIPEDKEIVGIAKDDKILYTAADDLWEAGFSLHEILVQADPEQLKNKIGVKYPDPNLIADNPKTPRKELTMPEEFGWLLLFSFSVPLFLGMVLGSIFASGITPLYDAIYRGLIGGGILGGVIGLLISAAIKLRHDYRMKHQMEKGGFVIWVHVDDHDKLLRAKKILEHDGVYNIHEQSPSN